MDIQQLKIAAKGVTLLYVEDEDELRNSVERYLHKIFDNVTTAANGQEGLKLYQKEQYDLVLTDIQMPFMNGLEMAKEIKLINPNQEIIIISAYSETAYFIDAIGLNVSGYIVKPINYLQMTQALHKSIFNLNNYKENLKYKMHLEEMVQERTAETIALEEEKIENFERTLVSFVSMVEDRDTYTGGHSQRVANYCRLIAKEMQCTPEECDLIYRAGILHDIGKVTTPDTILLKPGKLSELEFKLIKEHVSESYKILIKIPMYKDLAEIIICHHERYDGQGYPNGIKDKEVPFLSHIMIVADAFDAMTTNRIYKGQKSIASAIEELKLLSGKQFHPKVVESAVKVLIDIEISNNVNQLPTTEIEKERFSYFYRDQLTDSYNTDYLNFILNRNKFDKEYKCIHALYLHNFSRYNQKYGWTEGDKILNEVVDSLQDYFLSSLIFRIHGDDFIIISKKYVEIDLKQLKCSNILEKYYIDVSIRHINLDKQDIPNFKTLEILI
ncbi:MAG: response regulator [Sulfurimonas sp.]|nr:response regulator [Sulfurimonas sp.]